VSAVKSSWLSATAYSGMFGFSVVMALLGAILPLYVNRPEFDFSKAGNLFLAMNAAMLVATLLVGPALDRFGIRPAILIAPVAVAIAVVWIGYAQSLSALILAVPLLGTGGAALNQSTNTLIADLHQDPRRKNAALNVLGVFLGFGALFIPLTIGSLLPALGIHRILIGAAGLILIPVALATSLRFPPPLQRESTAWSDVMQLIRQPLVLVFAFLLFFQSGNEFSIGGYLASYLTRELSGSLALASYALAGYWAAIMLARAIMGRVLLGIRGEILIRSSTIGVAVCLMVLTFVHSAAVGAALSALLGLSVAGIFPTVLGLAGTRYPQCSGTVFGILIGIALVGGMTIPWLAGQIAAARGIRSALWLPAAGALAIFALQLVIEKLMQRRETACE
jgi:MFS transporter, FHS family, glucose/mannose:H+ symporter